MHNSDYYREEAATQQCLPFSSLGGEKLLGLVILCYAAGRRGTSHARGDEMAKTIVAPHGLFYMENAGGCEPAHLEIPPSMAANEHQPSCFALEEEMGDGWTGSGGMRPAINEARPSL